jgi:hypothetical protein
MRVGLYNFAGEVGAALSNAAGVARFDSVPYGNWGVYLDAPDSVGAQTASRVHVDGLAIEQGALLSPHFVINRCSGVLHVVVFDQDSALVTGYPLQLYTHLGAYKYKSTGAFGPAVFNVPCGNYGVIAEPHAGFSVTYDRGIGFLDGLTVTNGSSENLRLYVTRN